MNAARQFCGTGSWPDDCALLARECNPLRPLVDFPSQESSNAIPLTPPDKLFVYGGGNYVHTLYIHQHFRTDVTYSVHRSGIRRTYGILLYLLSTPRLYLFIYILLALGQLVAASE